MNLSFKFLPKNRYEILVLLLFFSLALMNWIPELESMDFLLFFAVFLFMLGIWFIDICSRKITNILEVSTIFFLGCLLIVNCISASLNGLQFTIWGRSASFIFIWFILLFFIRFSKKIEINYLLTIFVVSGLFWILINLVRLDSSIMSIFISASRITYLNQNFLLPYPLFLSLILLFCFKNSFLKNVLLVFSALIMLATGYKTHMLILGVALVYLSFKNKKDFVFIISLLFVSLFFFYDILYNYVVIRFNGLGGDGDLLRFREWEVALDIFYKNPLFGAGLGQGFHIGSSWGGEVEKSFIHNSILYLLATMGIFGFLIILAIFSYILWVGKFVILKFIFLSLLISTLTAANYKLIHFNMMLIILVSMLIAYGDNNRSDNGNCYSIK